MSDEVVTATCAECGAESTATRTMHESWCSKSIAAEQEAGTNGVRLGTVDGQRAIIVDVPPVQLVELTTEQLIGIVSDLEAKCERLEKEKKKAAKAHSAAVADLDAAVRKLVTRHRAEHGQEPLPFASVADEDDEAEDADDDDAGRDDA